MDRSELTTFLGHVSSSIGHQVINSLSTIVSQAEIVRGLLGTAEAESEEIQERIETIIRVSLDASATTRRLLELSHELTSIESLDANLIAEEIDLSELAASFLRSESARIGPSAQWELNVSPTPKIKGNREACLKMLGLLATNAVESLPAGGKGTISVAVYSGPRGWITLEIRDDGSGMTSEVLEHAAEPFFTTKPEHRGLGLTIARGIWRRHRGGLVIESQPGAGTAIRLTAPPSPGA